MDPEARRSWENFLDPETLRPNLIAASIYVAAFEALKDAIVGRIRDFFWSGFDESGDHYDPKYESDVLSRNRSPVYASLDWLKHLSVIEDSDILVFDRAKHCRNKLAHALFSSLARDGLPPEFEGCFHDMLLLLRQIELWWITNIEIATDPDLFDKDVDVDSIIPGRLLGIRLLCEIALGDDKGSRFYLNEFRRQAEDG